MGDIPGDTQSCVGLSRCLLVAILYCLPDTFPVTNKISETYKLPKWLNEFVLTS